KHAWHVILQDLQQRCPGGEFVEDDAVKYVTALCFLSDDPELYLNPQAVPFAIPAQAPDAEAPLPEPPPTGQDLPDLQTISSALFTIPTYEDYDVWIAVGQELHSTRQPWARALWDSWSAQSAKYNVKTQAAKWAGFGIERGRHIGDLLTLA